MAEFCKTCFVSSLQPSQDEIDHIVMSEEEELCEGCGKVLPVVDYVDLDVGVREP